MSDYLIAGDPVLTAIAVLFVFAFVALIVNQVRWSRQTEGNAKFTFAVICGIVFMAGIRWYMGVH